jgi:hypothetical protein
MKIKLTDKLLTTKRRAEKFQSMWRMIALGLLKDEAHMIQGFFQDGIAKGTFNLKPLKQGTIDGKTRQGYDKPSTPLYGKGDWRKGRRDSYVNMLRLRQIKDGWRVYPSTQMHWSGALPLNIMLDIHEKGRTIMRGETAIKIPKRPAFMMAKRKYAALKRNRKEMFTDMARGYIVRGSRVTKIKKYLDIYHGKENS